MFQLNNLAEALNFITEIRSGGGGDTPEAVIDGLYEAGQNMNWTKNAQSSSIKIVIHIGDAPPHGK